MELWQPLTWGNYYFEYHFVLMPKLGDDYDNLVAILYPLLSLCLLFLSPLHSSVPTLLVIKSNYICTSLGTPTCGWHIWGSFIYLVCSLDIKSSSWGLISVCLNMVCFHSHVTCVLLWLDKLLRHWKNLVQMLGEGRSRFAAKGCLACWQARCWSNAPFICLWCWKINTSLDFLASRLFAEMF